MSKRREKRTERGENYYYYYYYLCNYFFFNIPGRYAPGFDSGAGLLLLVLLVLLLLLLLLPEEEEGIGAVLFVVVEVGGVYAVLPLIGAFPKPPGLYAPGL